MAFSTTVDQPVITLVGFPYTRDRTTGRGIDRYLFDLCNGFEDKGLAISVIDEGKVRGNPLEFIVSILRVYFRLRRNHNKKAVYHAVDPLGAFVLIVARKKPIIVTIHDLLPCLTNDVSVRRGITQIIVKYVIQRSDLFIATFEYTKSLLQDCFMVDNRKVKLVNLGFGSSSAEQELIQSGTPNSEVIKLLHIGAFNHGSEDAVRVFKELTKYGLDAKLFLGGTGSMDKRISNLIAKWGMEDRVELLGFIREEDMKNLFSASDIFIYPSNLGFSYLVLQSMSFGTPVIAYDIWDMREFASDALLLCPYRDYSHFAKLIVELATNNRFRKELAERGRKRAADFSIARMVDGTLGVYAEAVKNNVGDTTNC